MTRERARRSGSRSAVPHRWDDRAVSSSVTHALALSITAILISGLLVSAGTILEDQREQSAREQLQTVGNRIASDLTRAGSLAQDGGNVSFRSTHPTSIAGQHYSVRLLTGTACDTELITSDTCLELELRDGRMRTLVPVRNESPVSFAETTTGVYRIAADANDSAPARGASTLERDLRVGIGSDIGVYSSGSVVNATNRDPIAEFTFSPGQPSESSNVTFRSGSADLDGVVSDHEWEFCDPQGSCTIHPEREGEINHSFSEPGKYTATLTVIDDDGGTDEASKVVSVGGLSYGGATARPLNASAGYTDGSIEFEVENLHDDPVVVREVRVDPDDDTIDRLDAEDEAHEIYVDGSVPGGYSQPENFYTDGRIFDIADDGLGPAGIGASDTATVSLEGFERSGGSGKVDMSDEVVFVAMRYEVGGEFYTAHFTLNGDDGNQPPVPAFDYSCSETSCTFVDDGSSDPESGSVESYAWNLGDGTTVKGPTETSVTHDFQANGTYDVSLTVTDDGGVSATETKSVQVGDPGPPVIFAVNAGGGETTALGVEYQGDTESDPSQYVTGTDDRVETTTDSIDGTSADGLYQTGRFGAEPELLYCFFYSCVYTDPGEFGYDVPAPDGEYDLTFHFAEIEESVDPGDRRFHVRADGDEIVSGLDVYDQVGDDEALDVTRTATVDDGMLTLEFVPDSDDRAPMAGGVVARLVDPVAFQEVGGEVVVEAENYHRALPGTREDASGDDMGEKSWSTITDGAASEGSALEARPDTGDAAGDTENGPRLDYYVDVETTGTYFVWVRMRCSGSDDDSVHVGFDGEPATFGGTGLDENATDYCHDASGWMWASHAGGTPTTVEVNEEGQYTLNVWMNEDGVEVDQVVMTTDGSYDPTGTTPNQSTEE